MLFRIWKSVTCHFFSVQKITFFTQFFLVTIMLFFFLSYYITLICYFFDSNLHKTRKVSRYWTSMMSKIQIDETLLGNSTRC